MIIGLANLKCINFAEVRVHCPIMEDLKLLKTPELMDLLSEETFHLIKLVRTDANREEFDSCKRRVKEIQAEIEVRRKNQSGSKQ